MLSRFDEPQNINQSMCKNSHMLLQFNCQKKNGRKNKTKKRTIQNFVKLIALCLLVINSHLEFRSMRALSKNITNLLSYK